MDKKNKMWRQQAKNFWLIGRDKNTKYFHSRATQRCRRNKISGIFNLNGVWVTQPNSIANSFTDYYQGLFTSSNLVMEEAALNLVPKLIAEEMNALLSQEFMDWEVQTALKQKAPLKAPGPDGMPPLFYQNYWSLVGCDVTKTILSYLNTATLPHPLNHTFITLIPKIKYPFSVHDFCLISLCNVLYKKFSKVLANRLKKILSNIISEHQSAFTKNQSIFYNILVAFETLHSMKKHKMGKTGYMAVKLDMTKAYDRVECAFLEEIIRKLRFEKRWINLMMVCVKSVSYSILVNGESKGLIRPSRGICQGNFLSPFCSYYAQKVYKAFLPRLPMKTL